MTRKARRAGKIDNTLMSLMAAGSVALLGFAVAFSGGDDAPPPTSPSQVAASGRAPQADVDEAGAEEETRQERTESGTEAPSEAEGTVRSGGSQEPAEAPGQSGRAERADDAGRGQRGARDDRGQRGRGGAHEQPELNTAGMAERLSGEEPPVDPARERKDAQQWDRRLQAEDEALIQMAGQISGLQKRNMRRTFDAFHRARHELIAAVQSGEIDRATFRSRSVDTFNKRDRALKAILGPAFARLDFDRAHFLAMQAN